VKNHGCEPVGSGEGTQILVVVAIIQTNKFFLHRMILVVVQCGGRALKTVVEKGSLSSAIEQGLVDPKRGT